LQTCRYEGRKFQGNAKKCLVSKALGTLALRGSHEMESSTVPILVMPCPKGLNRIRGSYEMQVNVVPIPITLSPLALLD
jgi:hypothetical protein